MGIFTRLSGRRQAPPRAGWALIVGLFIAASGAGAAVASAGGPPPLVFVHGIKGCELIAGDGEVRWLTPWQALGFSTPDLALPARFVGGTQAPTALHPGKILDKVLLVQIYGPFLEAAAGFGQPFYPFSYDWRRDNLETLEQLTRFVRQVSAKHGGARVQIVGHSMGGLLALALMNTHPELIDAAVLAGAPLRGGIGFLRDLQVGAATGLNDGLMAPAVVRTFPSVYTFFPLDGGGLLLDQEQRPLPADFYAADTWRRLKLGPFADGEPAADFLAFFEEALAHAKRFRSLLGKTDVPYPRILVVAGKDQGTLAHPIQNGPKAKAGWDFDTAPDEPGDGRVALRRAMPPDGIPYDTVVTPADHTGLLNDPQVQAAIRAFLRKSHPTE